MDAGLQITDVNLQATSVKLIVTYGGPESHTLTLEASDSFGPI